MMVPINPVSGNDLLPRWRTFPADTQLFSLPIVNIT
jgi:hypothetical protein